MVQLAQRPSSASRLACATGAPAGALSERAAPQTIVMPAKAGIYSGPSRFWRDVDNQHTEAQSGSRPDEDSRPRLSRP